MADKTFTYHGPLSAVTLPADAEHPDGRNVQLARGLRVTLPEDNDYVRSLVIRKYLVPVADPVAASTPAAAMPPAPAATTAETKTTQTGAAATATGA